MATLSTPKVSVITCFLNVENYIDETIQSVLQQEYTNWELLLVDDGSTDESTLIAKRYAAQYPAQIFYLEHEQHLNKGASYSRNIAIERSAGDYIAFIDADDTWHPDYLTCQIAILNQYPVAMVCEATEYWRSWSNAGLKDIIKPIGCTQDKIYAPPTLLLTLYPLGQGAAPCICGMVVRRDAILKHKGFDNYFTGMYDDQSLLIKLYLYEHIYISSAVHNRYRQRPESLVHTSHQTGKYKEERKLFLKWLRTYLKVLPVKHPDVEKMLRSALLPYRFPGVYYLIKTAPRKGRKILAKLVPVSLKLFIKQQQKAL